MTDIITIENGVPVLSADVAQQIADFEKLAKEIKAKEDELKEQIKAAMEQYNVIGVKTDVLDITYVAETTRESLDTKALKAECPDVYDAYCKISKVSPSIRLKVK